MIAVTNGFKTAMKQPIKELDAYISYDNSYIRSADDLVSFKVTCDSGLCKTAMRTLEAKYIGEHNLVGQWVNVGFGVKLPNGSYEYLDYGSFLVTEISTAKDSDVTTIKGYDKMILSMTKYEKLNIEYPMSLIDYTKLICNACGLELGNARFGDNLFDYTTTPKVKSSYTNTSIIENGVRATVKTTGTGYFYAVYKLFDISDFVGEKVSIKADYVVSGNSKPSYRIGICDANGENRTASGLTPSASGDVLTWTIPTLSTSTYLAVWLYSNSGNNANNGDYVDYTNIEVKIGDNIIEFTPYNPINDWQITKELWENINGITYRDILTQIAQVTGTTCIISNDDKVYFKSLKTNNNVEQLTYDNLMKFKLEPKYGEINYVILGRDPVIGEDVFIKNDASIQLNGLTEFRIDNNEIVDKDREDAIQLVYDELEGINYYPFEVTTEGLGWYEIADNFNIVNNEGDVFNTSLFNFSISIDGAITEILKSKAETKTQSQYQYTSPISKRVKNTEIIVDKQEQQISSLVKDMYQEDGIINENFTLVHQDIQNIINSVQKSGGNNLLKNSVMFAYDNDGKPNEWDVSECGKNLLHLQNTSVTHYGINSTTTNDNNISFSGTATKGFADISKRFTVENLPKGVYTFSTDTAISNARIVFYAWHSDSEYTAVVIQPNETSVTVNIQQDIVKYFVGISNLTVGNSYSGNVKLQLEKGNRAVPYIPYHTDGLIIDSNTESLSVGAISGHSFELLDKYVYQTVRVKKDDNSILEANKTYYTFSTKIKKLTTGYCYVRIYNSVEDYIIEIPSGQSEFYKEYEIVLLPKDTYYTFEFYGSIDSEATFTDNMLALGNYKSQWQQASGEIMNTQVNVNVDGVLVKSSVYVGDYTVMSPLEFAGYSKINGVTTKVFTINKDTTEVEKLKAKKGISMVPIKIVPVTSGSLQGWAFVPSTED